MRNAIILMLLAALTVTASCADTEFTLRDYLHHRWQNELVTYRVDKAKVPDPARLVGPDGQVVPVQVRDLGREAEVAFVVRDLPADGEVTYTLTGGNPVGRPMTQVTANGLLLEAGAVAALVPNVGEERPAGKTLGEVHAPLLSIRTAAGQWLGAGRLVGDLPVKSVKTTLVASGPVYAEARTDYELEGGRYWMTVRVIAGQPAVLVSEEFDTPATAAEKCYFRYDLKEGLEPQRMAVQGRLWRQRTDQQGVWPSTYTQGPGGSDYRIDFDADRREVNCIGYVTWWPETVRLLTLHAGPTGEALSFFPRRVGAWRNPMGSYLETRRDGSLYLELPLYVKQAWPTDGVEWGNPFYTGRLEPGWPRTASRRHWAFALAAEGDAFPAAGQSAVAQQIIKYSDLPLDKIKDWTFEWNWEGVKYPRLYVDPDKLAEVRARARQIPGWDKDLGTYYTRPLTYVLTGDPQVGEQLVRTPLSGPQDFAVAGAIPGLRFYVANLFDNWGYVGFPAPNNATPMIELVRFDAAMSVPEATEAERTEMQRLAAFVAQMVYDPDWHAVGSGWHMGNPNMPPRQENHLGVASRALPTHPLAKAWAERGAAEQQRLLGDMVKPSGAWRECPHYQFEAAMYPMMQAAVPLKLAGTYDVFADPRLKKTMNYLVNILTPPDPRFQSGVQKLRVLPAFGNGSWEFMPLPGWIAAFAAEDDPDFSKLMMWAWEAQGNQAWFQMSQLTLDPTLPQQQPELKSALFEGFGAVLRSGFPSDDETWMAFKHGDCIEHYNYGDQGSFMMYAKGAPLVLHFGSQYTPYYQGSWYFNKACFNRRPIVPADGELYQVLRNFDLDPANYSLGTEGWVDQSVITDTVMKTRGFFSGAEADYAHGEQVQTVQGVAPKSPAFNLPPNTEMPMVPIPETHWNRRIALLKDADPLAPNYFVIRDDILGEGNFPGEWNIWTPAQDVQVNGNRATATSKYGVIMDVYMAEPLQPQFTTEALTALPSPTSTNSFLAGPSVPYAVEKPWLETQINLRAVSGPNQGFLAVLYPRKANEAPATCETLADGKGVKVVTPRGTDWVFLSEVPMQWTGDGLSFSGKAGAIRRAGDKWTVVFFEPGTATVNGRTVRAEAAQEIVI